MARYNIFICADQEKAEAEGALLRERVKALDIENSWLRAKACDFELPVTRSRRSSCQKQRQAELDFKWQLPSQLMSAKKFAISTNRWPSHLSWC
ncbi:MAG: hypothetical protein SGPRY_003524 [Prymnesium sp.]